MSSLSSKSAQEISDLLDDYGIKHGPVVGEWLGLNVYFAPVFWINVHGSELHRPLPPSLPPSVPVWSYQVYGCSNGWIGGFLCTLVHRSSHVRLCVWLFLCSDSTRSLYEKKLKEAMAKGKRAKQSPDKTYYREEGNFCPFLSFAHTDMYSKGWKTPAGVSRLSLYTCGLTGNATSPQSKEWFRLNQLRPRYSHF